MPTQEERYNRRRKELLSDKRVRPNKETIINTLDYLERRLKNKQQLARPDEKNYKTLNGRVGDIKKILEWFDYKDLKKITDKQIIDLIENLEDGKITNRYGKRYEDREKFYELMKGRLFNLINKSQTAINY